MEQKKLPDDFFEKRTEIVELRKKINELRTEEKKLISWLQKNCDHESIAQTKENPPRRVCVICGFIEKGCDKSILIKDPIRMIDSDIEFIRLQELKQLKQVFIPID